MQQIADWLQKLDIAQYAQRFAEQGRSIEQTFHRACRQWFGSQVSA
jgi:hypothetical protein